MQNKTVPSFCFSPSYSNFWLVPKTEIFAMIVSSVHYITFKVLFYY